jgi:hypothetical protein
MSKKDEKFDLLTLWSRDKDAIKEEERELALDELEGSARNLKNVKKRAKITAEKAYKKALESSVENSDFAVIFNAKLKLAEALLENETVIAAYDEIFGE